MKLKLTKSAVDRIQPSDAERIVWDTELQCFGLRVTSRGEKSYLVKYRNSEGRQRKHTLGRHGTMTAEEARKLARELLGNVAKGGDPAAERKEARSAPTMADLVNYYFDVYAPQQSLAAGTTQKNRRFWGQHIKPRLGTRKVAAITQADIRALHLARKETPTDANRMLRFLSRLFTLAVQREWRASSPCVGIKLYPENKRERWLSEEEWAQLLQALDAYAAEHEDNAKPANAVRLMLLTGCRPQEAIQAKWDMFDLEARTWTMPSHHVKQRRQHVAPLSDAAFSLLEAMKAEASEDATYLFPGKDGEKPRYDVRRCWAAVCIMAGLEGVHLHDLRHTFASHLVSRGASLYLVGGMLGHTQAQTTQRYAHLAPNAKLEAANIIGQIHQAAQKGQQAEVIPLPQGKRRATS